MTRSKAVQVENDFSKGLLTEDTALSFPKNASTDSLNCVYDFGRVLRRGALDIESGYVETPPFNENAVSSDVFTEYLWTNVSGLGTKSFLVQQQGSNLHFFDVSASVTVSVNKNPTGH